MITSALEEEFRHLMNNDNATFNRVDARTRNARFLAEFVKFHVYPANKIFSLLDKLLENFSHNNIDVTCTIIESCGPYLLRGVDSRHRMDEVLQRMWRLRSAKNLGVCVC
jgi:regulator of nonsense transcripts 2